MRSPHRIATHPTYEARHEAPYAPPYDVPHAPLYEDEYGGLRIPSDGPAGESVPPTGPSAAPVAPRRNPYDELAALADNPLEDFLVEEPEPGTGGPESDDDSWTPPNHRRGSRRRNRFAGLPIAVKFVAGVLVLVSFLTLADRWAVLYAEHKAADKLKHQMHLSAAPEVEIGGFPFLTQLAAQRLDSVRVTVPDVAADRVTLAEVSATAHDVRIDGDGPTSVRGALVHRMRGQVLLSFADMNRELGASQVTFSGRGPDRVLARGTLPVAGHELRLRADARIRREGDRGIATSIGGMRLDIGDLATYRPGTRPSEGLHLTRSSVRRLARETAKAKAFLSVPAIVHRLGVPDGVVREALRDDDRLSRLTGTPRFLHEVMRMNLIDVALAHPWLLKRLGLDPSLLTALTHLTRPRVADRLSLSFHLPKPRAGDVRLLGVTVEKGGIRADVAGSGLMLGH
ncbi:LmeA family phospholipid-binding protein [Streptomyces sp. NPDC002004]